MMIKKARGKDDQLPSRRAYQGDNHLNQDGTIGIIGIILTVMMKKHEDYGKDDQKLNS